MILSPLKIEGAYLIEYEAISDERGFFRRQFCMNDLEKHHLSFNIKQCNLSHNSKAGVLRGMHYQKEPYPEIKLVSCFKGSIYDVLVDLRSDSPTYLQWTACELSAKNGNMIYVPPGVAHGFQCLEDDSLVYYQLGEFFQPDFYAGVRWNDPLFGIQWPDTPSRVINERDANYELYTP